MELKAPEIRGEMSQAVVACKTPLHRQSTPLEVKEAMPTPITPPMMLWVLETSIPKWVANVREIDDETRAQAIPSMRIAGCCSNASTLRIFERTVSATRALRRCGKLLF
jgi:hypothetical protein